eukprot:7346332-Pyramimonas_sp.AAC.2
MRRLLKEGAVQKNKLVHMQGGLNAWFRAGLPGEGETQWVFDSRTPSSAPSREEIEAVEGKTTFATRKTTGYSKLIKAGGNALDPFGSWSLIGKKGKK